VRGPKSFGRAGTSRMDQFFRVLVVPAVRILYPIGL
jgi:hypothetical protein